MLQKLLVVMFVTLLSGSVLAQDQQGPSSEQVLGAIAGGALGSTIGQGDGKKAATVIGAIIGYRNGDRFLNPNQDRHFDSKNYAAYPDREGRNWFERRRKAEWECRHEVPSIYWGDVQMSEAWIKGCIERKLRNLAQLERDAYMDGLRN